MFHDDPPPQPQPQPRQTSGPWPDHVKPAFAVGFIAGILAMCTVGFFILLLVLFT